MSVDDRSIERHLSIDSTLSLFCELIQGGQKESSGDDFTPSIPELTDEQKSYNKQVIRRFFGEIPYSDEAIARQEVISREVLVEVMKARGERFIEWDFEDIDETLDYKTGQYGDFPVDDKSYLKDIKEMALRVAAVVPNPYFMTKSGDRVFEMFGYYDFLHIYLNFLVETYSRQKVRFTHGTPDEHVQIYYNYKDIIFSEFFEGADFEKMSNVVDFVSFRTGHSFCNFLKALLANTVREALDVDFFKKTQSPYAGSVSPAPAFIIYLVIILYGLEESGLSLDAIFHKDTLPRINHPHIYLSLAPNDAMPPYATYTLEQVQELKDKSGYFGLDIVVKFDFYTHTPTAVSDESWLGFMRGVNVKNKQLVGHNGGIIITECDMIDMSLDKVDSVTYDKSYTYHYQVQWADNMISINN